MMKMGIIEEATAENGIIYPFPDPKDRIIISKKLHRREIFYRQKSK